MAEFPDVYVCDRHLHYLKSSARLRRTSMRHLLERAIEAVLNDHLLVALLDEHDGPVKRPVQGSRPSITTDLFKGLRSLPNDASNRQAQDKRVRTVSSRTRSLAPAK